MDELEGKIVRATQSGLSLKVDPYQDIATQLGIEKDLVMDKMRQMLADGKIRRIGVVPNHYKLGYTANAMSVWHVDGNKIRSIGHMVGALSFVSHCYQRPQFLPEWPYNLFAMVHGKDRDEVEQKIQQIARLIGDDCLGYELLYSKRILKKSGLRLT